MKRTIGFCRNINSVPRFVDYKTDEEVKTILDNCKRGYVEFSDCYIVFE